MAKIQLKKWYLSRTIWLNVAGVIVIGLQLALNQHLIPVDYQELVLAVVNILIRLKTNQGLTK